MARTSLIFKCLKSNALLTAGTTNVKTPAATGLYYGEISYNANSVDPTLYIPLVTNATITEAASTALITTFAEFKSKAWLDTNVIGGTPIAPFNTLTKISTYLSYLFGTAGDGNGASADIDSIINTWGEVKAFLANVTSDTAYDLVTLLNGRASSNLTYTSGMGTLVAKLYDNTSIIATAQTGYSVLKVDLTAALNLGSWDSTYATWTAGTAQTSNKAISAVQVQSFYDNFSKMFTEVDGKIRANMSFYSIGGVSAYGDGVSGSGSGLVTSVYSYANLLAATGATYTDTSLVDTINAYAAYMLKTRIDTLEGGSFTGITFTKNTSGFSIAGGNTTVKTLTVSNNITLAGTDGSTLNIGGGGTLGTGAFATIANYALIAQTMYIGTTALAINRASGSIDLTGITSIDGTAAKATNIVGGNTTTLLGAMPYQSAVNTTTLLAPNITITRKFMRMTGTGTNGAVPVWDTILAADIPTLNQNTTGLADSATHLATTRSIYGNNFDGTAALAQVIAGTYGGTGVNNGTKTITLGGNLSTAAALAIIGAYAVSITAAAATAVTLPTTGTILSDTSTLDAGTY